MVIKHLLIHRGFQILLISTLYFLLLPFLPSQTPAFFYTISLLLKDVLLWILPLTVCLFIAHAISSFEKKALLFVLSLFLFEILSNALSVWYAYGCGSLLHFSTPPLASSSVQDALSPLWRMPWIRPLWWSADKGTFAGIFLGLLASFSFPNAKKTIQIGKSAVSFLLTSVFARLIPLFILGFIARMQEANLLHSLYARYGALVLELVTILLVYIGILFLLGHSPKAPLFLQRVKNLFPAGAMAFSSGCSLSTMPWTIEGTAKNLQNPELAKSVIPATTNIQQIGDCITNSFLCFLIYCQFFGSPPDIGTWISFSSIFVLARFATAAVIGGAIFIMLPIYETYLHFTPEMIALILAFNVILDPIVTCSNVVANGALCRLFEMYWQKLQSAFPSQIRPH